MRVVAAGFCGGEGRGGRLHGRRPILLPTWHEKVKVACSWRGDARNLVSANHSRVGKGARSRTEVRGGPRPSSSFILIRPPVLSVQLKRSEMCPACSMQHSNRVSYSLDVHTVRSIINYLSNTNTSTNTNTLLVPLSSMLLCSGWLCPVGCRRIHEAQSSAVQSIMSMPMPRLLVFSVTGMPKSTPTEPPTAKMMTMPSNQLSVRNQQVQ